ncbi:MAG: DDE-type integrase/transposase/recombinase [Candidatus Competibacter denitrificans]
MAEIARALGISVQAGNQRSVRESWTFQKAQGRGGGKCYEFSLLPGNVQAAILKRESRTLLTEGPLDKAQNQAVPLPNIRKPSITKAEGDAKAATATGKARDRMDARLAILRQFEQFIQESPIKSSRKTGGTLQKEAFCAAWNQGRIDHPAHSLFPIISSDKLTRWGEQLRSNGLYRLAGTYGHRRGSGLIDLQPQLSAALRCFIYEYPHGQAGIAHQWLCSRYDVLPAVLADDGPIHLPGRRTVARWLERWKHENAELYTLFKSPDEWKNRYMIGWGDADAHIHRLNQLWEFDSTPADVMLADGRHSILGVIDVYSRRVRLHVSKTSRATAVASLLRGALMEWGIPEIAKTDNGQEYVSHHLTRIFQALEIEQHLSAPFSPWQKPHIERFFRSFSHHLLEYLPGYIGHNVAERENIRARQQFSDRLFVKDRVVELALNAEQLQSFCDRWVASYHTRPHAGLGEQCPLERVQRWQGPTRRVPDARILDLLLSEAPGDGYRTVTKSYGLRIDNFTYGAAELGLCVGQRVKVLYDPEGDMGRVVVFDERGDYLCIAECPEVTGIPRQQMTKEAQAVQKANAYLRRKDQKAETKKLSLRATFNLLLEQRAELLALSAPDAASTETHDTAAIRAALDALANRGPLSIGEGFTPQQARAMGYLDPAPPPEQPPPAPEPVTRIYENEFEAMRDLYERTRNGRLGPGDAAFITQFYAENPAPRLFEKQMTEIAGFEAYHAWKQAALADYRATTPMTRSV